VVAELPILGSGLQTPKSTPDFLGVLSSRNSEMHTPMHTPKAKRGGRSSNAFDQKERVSIKLLVAKNEGFFRRTKPRRNFA
jgi:hypothetical protein